jgi:phenylalanyl-tRNA synthetase beta subunit
LIDGVPGFLGEFTPGSRATTAPLAPMVFELALTRWERRSQGAAVSRFLIVRRDIAVIVDEGWRQAN